MEIKRRKVDLPIVPEESCSFEGYDAASLMTETTKLRKLVTKRGTFEILIPLCSSPNPVRYMKPFVSQVFSGHRTSSISRKSVSGITPFLSKAQNHPSQ